MTTPQDKRPCAPWADWAGFPLQAGDTIVHPTGERGVVLYWPNETDPSDRWRVAYEGSLQISRLSLQVSGNGMALLADRDTAARTHSAILTATNETLCEINRTLTNNLQDARETIKALQVDAEIAIAMLAEWCVAVDQNGTGWDDWDEHYKDAAYRDGPLRVKLDAAIAAAKEQHGG